MTSPVLYLPSVESFACAVLTEADPTAGAVAFTLTAAGTLVGSETWSSGSWDGDPDQVGDRYRSRALTPLIGPAQSIAPTAGTWHAWCRLGGSGGVIKPAGILIVR